MTMGAIVKEYDIGKAAIRACEFRMRYHPGMPDYAKQAVAIKAIKKSAET